MNTGPLLYAFEAILVFQFVYILFQYFFIKKGEYLWYAAYIGGMLAYTGIMYEQLPFRHQLDKILPILIYIFYYRFASSFLELPQKAPEIMQWIKKLEKVLIAYILIEAIWKLLGQNPQQGELLFQLIASLLFICTATLIFLFIQKKPTYAYFVIAGASLISLGSFGSMISIILLNSGYRLPFDPLLFNNVAVSLELIIFTSGLAYKSRLAEIEKTNLSYSYARQLEHNMKLDKELNSIKNKIAEDIHQELGEGISNISVYTGIAEKQARDENSLLRETLFKIRKIALEMHATLQDLSWSLNFQHINEKKLIEKFKQIEREELLPRNLHLIIQECSEHDDQFLTLNFCRKAIQSLRFAVMACVHHNSGTLILKFNKHDFVIEVNDLELNENELNEKYSAPGIRWNTGINKAAKELRVTNFRD